jgi:hypothetical protein
LQRRFQKKAGEKETDQMKQPADISDYLIILFIAIVFIGGAYTVFKFMRGGKK